MYNLITILGPTAVGKTAVAANLAYKLNTEIISADSRQVYRGMNLGTGKDYEDYTINGIQIPCHLIDIVDSGEKYNVFEYQKDFLRVFNEIQSKGKTPILCGGSGLYIEAVIDGYNLISVPINEKLREELTPKTDDELAVMLASYQKLHNQSDTTERKRLIRAIEIAKYTTEYPDYKVEYPEINTILIGITCDLQLRRERITSRLRARLESGMIEEVQNLMNNGVSPDTLIYYGLEYKFTTNYLLNKISYSGLVEHLNIAIHQFAKRQMTWFRHMERKGKVIHWIDGTLPMEEKVRRITELTQ